VDEPDRRRGAAMSGLRFTPPPGWEFWVAFTPSDRGKHAASEPADDISATTAPTPDEPAPSRDVIPRTNSSGPKDDC
jgi:hypothetical protein